MVGRSKVASYLSRKSGLLDPSLASQDRRVVDDSKVQLYEPVSEELFELESCLEKDPVISQASTLHLTSAAYAGSSVRLPPVAKSEDNTKR